MKCEEYLLRVVRRLHGGYLSRSWILSPGVGLDNLRVPADPGLPKTFRKQGRKKKWMLQTSASPFCRVRLPRRSPPVESMGGGDKRWSVVLAATRDSSRRSWRSP